MTRREAVAVALWAAALAMSLFWIARHLVVTTDLSAFLPAVATPSQALVVDQLREGVASRVMLIGLEGADVAALAAASTALVAALAKDGRFVAASNGDPAALSRERDVVHRWRYLLSPGVSADRFTAQALNLALRDAQRLVASPLAPIVRPLIASDPTGETARIAERIAGGTRGTQHGVWFSSDGRRALVTAVTRAPGFDLDAQRDAAHAIRTAFARVAPTSARLVLSSPGLVAVESRERIEADAKLASMMTLAGVAVLLVATYRSAWPVALSAIPALTGLALAVVVVGAVFGPVHAITLGFGAMVVGEAIDYPTYLFSNNAPGEDLAGTDARIGGTLALAAATTACGALAMVLSGFRGLAQLGVLVLSGVIVAALTTRFVLPALTPSRALTGKRNRPYLPRAWLRSLATRRVGIVAVMTIVALGVLIVERDELWDDDLAHLNPVSSAVKAQDRELRAEAGAPDLRFLIVARGRSEDEALAASERVAPTLEDAVARRWIGGYQTPAEVLPSAATQRARQAALPDPGALDAALSEALADLPFRADAFDPFRRDVERSRTGPLLTRADLAGTALALRVDALLVRRDDGYAALLPLIAVDNAAATAGAIAAMQEPGVTFLDLKGEADALVAGYRVQSLRSTLIGFACIVGVLWLGTRSWNVALRLVAPVLAATVLTAAALVVLGQRLNVFHLVALLLVVGVGLNYALFFGRSHRSPAERDLALLSVTVAGLATLCASVSLALASTPVLKAIGTTTALGAVFSFVVAAMLSRKEIA